MKIIAAAVVILLCSVRGHAMSVSLPPDGSDATPALNAVIASVCSSQTDRTIKLPAGVYNMRTVPNAIGCAANVIGEGRGSTQLVRRYSGGYMLKWTRGIDQSGGSVQGMSLMAGAGTSGGVALLIEAIADTDPTINSFNRHSFMVDNVMIGREAVGASFAQGIYFDGSKNPENTIGIAPGIRLPTVMRTSISATTGEHVRLNKAVSARLHQVECYIPLDGSWLWVTLDNATDGVLLQSESCGFRIVDSASVGARLIRGVSVGNQ
ncbi:MAG: hypothetical protein ACRECO_19070 [Xanthobacteraceae bacterium]